MCGPKRECMSNSLTRLVSIRVTEEQYELMLSLATIRNNSLSGIARDLMSTFASNSLLGPPDTWTELAHIDQKLSEIQLDLKHLMAQLSPRSEEEAEL